MEHYTALIDISPWPCCPPRPAWSWSPGPWWRWWRWWPASAPPPLSTHSGSTSCEVSTSCGQLSTAASRQNCLPLSLPKLIHCFPVGGTTVKTIIRGISVCILMIVSTQSLHSNIETSSLMLTLHIKWWQLNDKHGNGYWKWFDCVTMMISKYSRYCAVECNAVQRWPPLVFIIYSCSCDQSKYPHVTCGHHHSRFSSSIYQE